MSAIKNRFRGSRDADSNSGGSGRPPGGGGNLVSARQIQLSGQWGRVFGPLDLDIDRGGVTLIKAPPGSPRTALMMAICGRMKIHRGQLTVLGHTNDQQAVFKETSLACFEELDAAQPSVTVRDLITEQIRWNSSFFKWVPLATSRELEEMCGYLFEGLTLPPIDAFLTDLPELHESLIRIGIQNTARKPLLVVGRLDLMADRNEQDELLERLLMLGQNQTVVAAHVNADDYADRVDSVLEVDGLFGFMQRPKAAEKLARADLDHEAPTGVVPEAGEDDTVEIRTDGPDDTAAGEQP